MKQFFLIIGSIIGIAVGIILLLAYAFNQAAVDAMFGEVGLAVFTGIKILFFTVLGLGVVGLGAKGYLEFRKHQAVTLIAPNWRGTPVQAVIHKGELVQLAQVSTAQQQQMDPLQQLQYIQKLLQMQSQMHKYAASVQEIAPAPMQQIAGPASGDVAAETESIGAVVRYSDVEDEVPSGMSLLGIHPASGLLELCDWLKLKCLWVIGSSSTGKSNTVYGKALEARNHGAGLLVVDQHINKPDSLAKKLAPLAASFLRPIAVSDEEVIAVLRWFKTEFERRVADASGATWPKIVLICDEMNRMARSENTELVRLLKEIVAICGEESRGFDMYGWFISQKAAHMKWLRDSAITVIAHKVTRMEEAKLACNDDLKAARKLLNFPIGRVFVYGVDFDNLIELQQPLYEVEGTISVPSVAPSTEQLSPSISSSINDGIQQGGQGADGEFPFDPAKLKKMSAMMRKKCSQQEIVSEIWGVQPNTRAFNAALVEYREMLAYLASMVVED